MLRLIYRGHDIAQAKDGMWEWLREDGVWIGAWKTPEEVQAAIDAHKRRRAKTAEGQT